MDVQELVKTIADRLKHIDGVRALVLGGSRARGTHHAGSDIDIGIYYDGAAGLDVDGLRQAAADLDDEGRDNLITEIGGWGPWINGGGWLRVEGMAVDFLLRDLRKVSLVMDQCLAGDITIDYQPGHPHGFVNAIYFAELALCKVVWDPEGLIAEMKRATHPYPRAMQAAIAEKFLWEAGFSLDSAGKGVRSKDLSYIAGCCFRSVSCLNQVLFALNGVYWMNEKGAAAIAGAFRTVPANYTRRVHEVMALIKEDQADLAKSLDMLRQLIRETEALMAASTDLP